MKKVLFLAPYPTEKNSKDGMISRVKAIDHLFNNIDKVYLDVSLFRNSKYYNDKNIKIFDINLFLNFGKIIRLLQSNDMIYCHSLYSVRYLWILLIFCRTKIVLDIHGVVPEEELYYYGHRWRAFYFKIIEWIIFLKIDVAICVTKKMRDEYIKRYSFARCRYLIYGIFPIELFKKSEQCNESQIVTDKIEILYSGGVQKWQNISLMLDIIKQNCRHNIHYTILTGDQLYVEKMAEMKNIDSVYLDITSCDSSELVKYYRSAHYAFILRDESIVNRVANPTKLIEYLFYGIIPIVLNPMIGDYFEMGYDFINVNSLSGDENPIVPKKSRKNMEIAKKLIEEYQNINFCEELLEKLCLK